MSSTKSILITGGGGGIGLEMARLLASREHCLILVGRDAARLQAAANELRATHGTEVHVHSVDLSEPGAAQQLFEHTQKHGFHIDTLINNAGFGIVDAHIEIEPSQIYRMLQLNVVAVAELCRCYGELMKHRRAGRIVNIASTAPATFSNTKPCRPVRSRFPTTPRTWASLPMRRSQLTSTISRGGSDSFELPAQRQAGLPARNLWPRTDPPRVRRS